MSDDEPAGTEGCCDEREKHLRASRDQWHADHHAAVAPMIPACFSWAVATTLCVALVCVAAVIMVATLYYTRVYEADQRPPD